MKKTILIILAVWASIWLHSEMKRSPESRLAYDPVLPQPDRVDGKIVSGTITIILSKDWSKEVMYGIDPKSGISFRPISEKSVYRITYRGGQVNDITLDAGEEFPALSERPDQVMIRLEKQPSRDVLWPKAEIIVHKP